MAVCKVVWVRCDTEGCDESTHEFAQSVDTSREAIAMARSFGWRKRGGRWVCDVCLSREKGGE